MNDSMNVDDNLSGGESVAARILSMAGRPAGAVFGAWRMSGSSERERGALPSAGGQHPNIDLGDSERELRRQAGRLVDFLAQTSRSGLDLMASLPTSGQGPSQPLLRMGDARPGETTKADVWLHRWVEPMPPTVRATSPEGHRGNTLGQQRLLVTNVEPITGQRADTVRLSVQIDVPEDATPDVYRFALLLAEDDSAWLPVEVAVTSTPAGD